MRKLFLVVAATTLGMGVLSGSASAQGAAAAAPAKTSVAGDWNASYNTPGGARTFLVQLVVDGQKLTGTVKREAGDSPLVGTIKGDTVTFTYAIKYGDNMLDMTVAAKLTGDTMKGTVDFAGQAQEAFEAKKIVGPGKL